MRPPPEFARQTDDEMATLRRQNVPAAIKNIYTWYLLLTTLLSKAKVNGHDAKTEVAVVVYKKTLKTRKVAVAGKSNPSKDLQD